MNHKERISEIYNYALAKFEEHQLNGWSFELFKSSSLGLCNGTTKTISLNYALAFYGQMDKVKETILHEIAHALAGIEAGHGPRWKYFCDKIGAKPSTFQSVDNIDIEVLREIHKYEVMYKKPDGDLEALRTFANRKPKDLATHLFFGRPETQGNLVYVVIEKKATPFKRVVLFKKP